MSKEVELYRLRDLMRKKDCRSLSTIEEIQQVFGGVYMRSKLEVAVIQDEPDWLAVVLQDHDDPGKKRGDALPLCAAFRKEDLESFARSVLQVDPPVEQQILAELQALRKGVIYLTKQAFLRILRVGGIEIWQKDLASITAPEFPY